MKRKKTWGTLWTPDYKNYKTIVIKEKQPYRSKNSTKENQKCSQKFLKMEWAFFIMPESTCQNQFQIQHGRTDISPREQSKKKPYLNDQI
jgi:hypothetical protein